jgi:hypothetical protein
MIAAEWEKFRLQVLDPLGMSEARTGRMMEVAFYAGAGAMFRLLMESACTFDELEEELKQFRDRMRAKQ